MEKDKDKKEAKYAEQNLNNDVRLIPPEERLKHVYDIGANFPFELNNSILRYYRSGKELVRQGDIYLKEGDFEKAYILYIRYMTICLEKLPSHPEYKNISPLEKKHIKVTLRDIIPKTEAMKQKLNEQFQQEHMKRKKEIEEQQKVEAERLKQEEQRLKEEEERKNQLAMLVPKTPHINIAAGALTGINDYRTKMQVILPKPFTPPYSEEQARSSKDRRVPSIDRSTKPPSLMSTSGLRNMIIPSKLMQNFLKLAFSNTSNNIETCGILAGRLERNRLIVTHFLIPKQTGSPDSCITHNEEEIFDFQDQHHLITLGWIHTHPTQTAFLSSVDLHTHCAYQLMMAEAIAIVCAPKYDETGFFQLTPDFGLNYIANCRETGFHPHPSDTPLFATANHFKLDSTASIEAVDLRNRSESTNMKDMLTNFSQVMI